MINTLRYDPHLCTGCGMCAQVCPHEVFTMKMGKAWPLKFGLCMECGACQMNCPSGAISVDSGVGCATAMISAALRGGKAECTCGGQDGCCQ